MGGLDFWGGESERGGRGGGRGREKVAWVEALSGGGGDREGRGGGSFFFHFGGEGGGGWGGDHHHNHHQHNLIFHKNYCYCYVQ